MPGYWGNAGVCLTPEARKGKDVVGPSEPRTTPNATPRGELRRNGNVSDEVMFLQEGMAEVQRAAQLVYGENVELRNRMELLRMLFGTLCSRAELPKAVREDIQGLLDMAVPPRNAFEDDDDQEAEPAADSAPARLLFARRAYDLHRTLEQMPAPPDREGWSGGFWDSRDYARPSDEGPEGEPPPRSDQPEEEVLALEDVSAWERTRLVIRDLCTGW